ncbi:DNA replication primase [Bacillus phage SWEP1]|nr:DNA replication primase [Bacillus phage SWEP1]
MKMIKKIALVAPLLLLAACGDPEPKPDLVTVNGAEVVETDARECLRACDWHITVKKDSTTIRMETSREIANSVSKGSKVNVTYNPDSLEVTRVTFPDFENKEEKKDVH